ncbi:hypothetical protein GXW74_10120 [Roseomonas eburnea]|uniref:Uncharacterized protein n=1 Tax=Neoroseomonas eburnea TaxID=1346889 RepID=A0A9X9XAV8_9PROT|nr:hypothetical protein [Neoroseomonas eburnea]MBR0680844.1 hypothetical protein [Neoroseomonas eburnea]
MLVVLSIGGKDAIDDGRPAAGIVTRLSGIDKARPGRRAAAAPRHTNRRYSRPLA